MRKITALVFAFVMMLSMAFIGGEVSRDNSFSAQSQTVKTTRRKKGIARKTYAGGKYVVRKVYRGGRYVTVKTWQGTKWIGKKSYKTGRKVVSRTKKVVY